MIHKLVVSLGAAARPAPRRTDSRTHGQIVATAHRRRQLGQAEAELKALLASWERAFDTGTEHDAPWLIQAESNRLLTRIRNLRSLLGWDQASTGVAGAHSS
jgi:hypothetical protein